MDRLQTSEQEYAVAEQEYNFANAAYNDSAPCSMPNCRAK